jgi:hypothetical protein
MRAGLGVGGAAGEDGGERNRVRSVHDHAPVAPCRCDNLNLFLKSSGAILWSDFMALSRSTEIELALALSESTP